VRTFVIADAHGYPELIENALRHGEFHPGEDNFVFAGDLLDRGPDAESCLGLVERYATEVLFGNHEAAVLLGFPILPQNPASLHFRPLFFDKLFHPQPVPWKTASCVEVVLITHAGVSRAWSRVFRGSCRSNPRRLADHLNEQFFEAVLEAIETSAGEWSDAGILGYDGPLWFRPNRFGGGALPGCTQIAGHTPPSGFEPERDLYLIDPDTSMGLDDSGRFRYALVVDGVVTVVEGSLSRP